jgi:hypothetical protein
LDVILCFRHKSIGPAWPARSIFMQLMPELSGGDAMRLEDLLGRDAEEAAGHDGKPSDTDD